MKNKPDTYIICPNCENEFDGNFEFCQHCGQKNIDRRLDFKFFIGEFLASNFNIDSKIFRTLKLLLFYPGKLTKDFIAGKRMAYLSPVRLYLIISLIYFTLLSFMDYGIFKFSENTRNKEDIPVMFYPEGKDSSRVALPGINDTLMASGQESSKEETGLMRLLQKLNTKAGRKNFNDRLPDYISVGMFILMPLTALIFYQLFFKNTYYIQHLIFVIHLQSAMYILFIVFNLIELGWSNDWIDALNVMLFLALLMIWIKKFYGLKWFKTVWKTILFLFIYGITFFIFLVAVAAINFYSI